MIGAVLAILGASTAPALYGTLGLAGTMLFHLPAGRIAPKDRIGAGRYCRCEPRHAVAS
jgi:hypothetical protein